MYLSVVYNENLFLVSFSTSYSLKVALLAATQFFTTIQSFSLVFSYEWYGGSHNMPVLCHNSVMNLD